MRSCSHNYQRDAYILKLDISGFFMSIERERLWGKVRELIGKSGILEDERNTLLYLIRTIIFTDARKGVKIVGKRTDWAGLPRNKSLFYTKPGCGLPIGNLTSQIFANIYMHEFDIFAKKTLKVRYYGRYVDDFILIHEDSGYLKECISCIRGFLERNLGLTLHPRKIYLQHISKGVLFLGTYILPWRKYIGSRTKGNFWRLIEEINRRIAEQDFYPQGVYGLSSSTGSGLCRNDRNFSDAEKEKICSQVNSYLGLMVHTDSYRLREKMIGRFDERFWEDFLIDQDIQMLLYNK